MAVALGTVVDVAEADVLKAGRLAARLTRSPDGVVFSYVEGYDGPAVATTLPVTEVPVLRPGGALPSYFTGLLPEGRRLSALRRAVKTSVDDELSLLLAVGADTIGDVQVVPRGQHPTASPRVQLGGSVRFRDLLAELDLSPDRTGLPGVQDKVSAAMINLPVARAGLAYLLKLDPPEYPGLVENEAVLLRACAVSGLQAAEGELIRDVDGAPGLVVTRFDRTAAGSLGVEDGCQVQGRSPGDKYTVGYAATFTALASVCDARLLAARTLLSQLVFAILSGNGDAHAKNFSVLQQPDGEWRVSPAYDLPTSQPYGDSTLAMPVNGRRSDVGAVDVIALGKALGLPDAASRRVLRAAVEKVDAWLPLLEELPYDAARRAKLVRVVTQRRFRLTVSPP
jgi:serine/threonine-protein kinase HipA